MGRASLSRGATQFSRGSIYKKSPSSCKGREHPRYHPNCLPATPAAASLDENHYPFFIIVLHMIGL